VKLRVSIDVEKHVTLWDVGPKVAEAYGRYAETGDDDDFDLLVDLILDDVQEKAHIVIEEVEIGR
jgi:DNA-binding Lrp family transcriptional regulator